MISSATHLAKTVDLELSTDIVTEAWPDVLTARSVQAGGDLGSRLLHALTRAVAEGRPKAVVMGTDSPGLPVANIEKLLALDSDVSLGPTDDGGFYAIACRRVHTDMFRDVRWSVACTLDDTVRAVTACGLSVEIGPRWFDIDTIDDLIRLAGAESLPTNTRQWLSSKGGLLGPASEKKFRA